MLGHRHATISLICMSTHKAMAARCLNDHQAAYGQPAIQALATAPLRRPALSVLFTIVTNSYQTTCTVSERTFNKRQHANARHGVDFSLFTHYDNVNRMTDRCKNIAFPQLRLRTVKVLNPTAYEKARFEKPITMSL